MANTGNDDWGPMFPTPAKPKKPAETETPTQTETQSIPAAAPAATPSPASPQAAPAPATPAASPGPPPTPAVPQAATPPAATTTVDPLLESALGEKLAPPPSPDGQGATDEEGELEAPPAIELPPLKLAGDELHIDDLLRYIAEHNASDLHAKVGSPPTIRVSGHLHPLDYPVLKPEECQRLGEAMMRPKDLATLDEKGECDFAYSLPGLGRFRVNIHRQRGTLGIAARRILSTVPTFDQLRLPPAVEKLASEHRGLVLVTGPTSSGKTTTCGAMLKHINRSRRAHIVTIEDPIEILHNDEQSVVTQREVGQDTMDFRPALRAAMRQDPDVIFVGEIRDTETVKAALQAAETGHFVLATLHTTDVAETVNRILDFFPTDQQNQVRAALAGSLVGVISQRLLPKVGGGRAPAIEIMIMNGRIRDTILDPNKTHLMHEIVEESSYYGMQTFDQALVGLFQAGEVTIDDARAAANSPHDFELVLHKMGLR